MRPTIVTSASVMTPFAGLSCPQATPLDIIEATTATPVIQVRLRMTQGFLICHSLATRFRRTRRRRRRRLGRARGGRRADRFLRALLRLQIDLLLLRAIQELFEV